ncbi:MAG: HU family DNA-binding protein [Candidatus Hydrogenedentes bacterium]|nr:HU family DNA-binding protein [Candidatus Hydrogenedentota bacterium]
MAFKKAKKTEKSLTKTQMVTMLAEATDLSKKDVTAVLTNLAALACAQSPAASGCTIPGLGKLKLVDRKARMGRNPATGESIKIPKKTVVKFVVAKAAKDAIVPPKK